MRIAADRAHFRDGEQHRPVDVERHRKQDDHKYFDEPREHNQQPYDAMRSSRNSNFNTISWPFAMNYTTKISIQY
ncbi:MAG TPA: hypothetical protein VHG89_09890 [Verrucomicrobiae bacterium]|nr:hypothetical protein [Verrucomicrobiae bacterium]